MGFIYSIIAGAAMSIQGVMNTRLGEKTGLYAANAYVQGTAFLLSLIAVWICGKVNIRAFSEVNKWYLSGGVLGLIITITVMLAMGKLTPTLAVSTILIAQLLTAACIDAFGLMGSEKLTFGWNKYLGLVLMTGGVLLFKWKTG